VGSRGCTGDQEERRSVSTPPGVYFIEIDEVNQSTFTFFIDPLLDVIDESLLMVNPTTGRVNAGKFLDGTLKVFQMPGNQELFENVNYTTDPDSGLITLMNALPVEDFLSVDYRWPATTPEESPAVRPDNQPWTGAPNRGLVEPLPGVVLAFGRRIESGDRMAVVVQRTRTLSAQEFGGRWDLNFDFDVIARDPHTQREILDQTAMYIWSVMRPRLGTEVMEISTISLGGETEEVYDETGDDYFYNASFSLTVQTDWSLHVPLAAMIQRVQPLTAAQSNDLAGLTDEEAAQIQSNIRPVEDLLGVQNPSTAVEDLGLGLRSFRDPFFKVYAGTYEKLK